MNCPDARDLFPALLDARTAATEHLEARAHLAACPACQRDFTALCQTISALDSLPVPAPSSHLRRNFYAMLEEEKHSAASVRAATVREQRVRRVARWRWILAPAFGTALLIGGFLTGTRYPSAPAPAEFAADATQREIRQLRDQVNKMGRLVGYQLLQQQQGPANDRLRDVLVAARSEEPGDRVLDNLISALAFDPSANVRLRALEALYPHADNALVRAGVLAALPREQNPLVQLELIDFVGSASDREAVPALQEMSQSESVDRSVRDAARRALAQL